MTNKETTFAMIKPDAVRRGQTGRILHWAEDEGFCIEGMQFVRFRKDEAAEFYASHRGKPFFESLVEFASSGPVVLLALSAVNAVSKWRNLIGDTNPRQARPGTIRFALGSGIPANAVHGSDSVESVRQELDLVRLLFGFRICG